MMNLITLENIYKSYSEKILLNNIKLNITSEDKIGIIGVNGAGKSTLLKIIAGVETIDAGNIIKSNGLRIQYLAQESSFNPNDTVMEAVFKGDSEVMNVIREYEEVLTLLSKDSENKELQNKLYSINNKMDAHNCWQIESEAKAILNKLGIIDLNQPMGTLSGGQRKRVALCNTLISPCDLLVLDEPTNHMDNELIDFLEELLSGRKSAVIMITHDRYFLDRIANKIIELDRGDLYSYIGNYSLYLEKKMERMELMETLERKRQNLYKKELSWIKRGAKARSTKQKARIQRFEEICNDKTTFNDSKVEINTATSRLGKKIVEVENLAMSYDNKLLLKDFSYIFTKEDKIGIIGRNGVGKTTLLNILANKIHPSCGSISFGQTVKIGYFNQENYEMNHELRVIDYVKETAEFISTNDGVRITASQMLEKFLFEGSMQYTPISKLSGGEKRRLYLLKILMEAPNVLLLDEPTNDLDIETLKILEDYLDNFNGAIITVSHDRYFLDRIVNKIFSFEGDGKVMQLVGNYSDYSSLKEQESKEQKEISEPNIKDNLKVNNKKEKPLKFTFKEQKEFEEIDDMIEAKEEAISELELKINNGSSDFVLLQELLANKTQLEEELDYLLERWTYLNELNEKIINSKS
jgi:ATP-binding cassette subfamily F protein uup